MSHIFISYSRRDRDFAKKIVHALEKNEIDTWIDWHDIPKGEDWKDEIYRGIEEADAFLFLISPDSVTSVMCNKEIAHAVKNNKRIIPIVLRDADINAFLIEASKNEISRRNWIFCRYKKEPPDTIVILDNFEKAIEEACKTIHTDYEWLKYHTELQVKALKWDEKKDNSRLLRGKELREAEDRLAKTGNQNDPQSTELHRRYILASQRNEVRQRRQITFSLGLGLVIVTLLAAFAWEQRNEAVSQRTIAETNEAKAIRQAEIAGAGQLAAQSQSVPLAEPQTALLLGVEAYRFAYKDSQNRYPLIEQALHDGLSRSGGLPLLGHTSGVSDVVFSPNGDWLATAAPDGTVRLWHMGDVTTAPVILNAHNVQHLAFSRDGLWLAAAGRNLVYMWKMTDLTMEPLELIGHEDDIWAITFSNNGHWLATAGVDQKVHLWDVTNPDAPATILAEHTDVVKDVEFSPDDHWLATASSDRTARLWQVNNLTASPIVLADHSESVNAVAFSPDGQWLATASDDNTTHLWQMNDLSKSPVVLQDQPPGVHRLAFSSQGDWLATVTSGSIRLWDMHSLNGFPIILPNPPGALTEIAFSPDDHWLAAGSQSGVAGLWDMARPDFEPKLFYDHEPWVTSIDFSADGQWLVTGSYDQSVRLWRVDSPYADPLSLERHRDIVNDFAISPDGKWMATASKDSTVRLWQLDNPFRSSTELIGTKKSVQLVAISPDGSWIASASNEDMIVCLWRIGEPAAAAHVFGGYTAQINALAFSPDSHWLATASGDILAPTADNTVRLFSVDRPEVEPVTLGGYEAPVKALVFSPSGRWLATAAGIAGARVWDMNNPTAKPWIYLDSFSIDAVAFSPDEHWLATGSANSIKLWQMNPLSTQSSAVLKQWRGGDTVLKFSTDGQWLAATSLSPYAILLWDMNHLDSSPRQLLGHEHVIVDLDFRPDGKLLASGSLDGTVRLWDLPDPTLPPLVLDDLGHEIWKVRFNPDGSRLLASGNDRRVLIWLVDVSDLVSLACQTVGRNLNGIEWNQYFSNETYRLTCSQYLSAK